MANTNYILRQIRIGGVLKDLLARSDGENVTVSYDGVEQTLASALAAILARFSALPTGGDVDGKIRTAIGELVNGAPETGDTLKELFDLISSNKSAMDLLNDAIGNKAAASELTAALERIAALEGKTHEHGNKAVLDGITAEQVSAWDGVRGVRYGAEPPNDMKDGEMFVRVVGTGEGT